ncbi:MAG: hypothetical protein IKV19_06985 [Bacteroidaceae bacterium]|nr:hypothetical protein [Bacteroidaceae bacterium]
MKLYIFNPENDLALADGSFNYCPPPAAMCIAKDLASLPLWYAGKDDAVFLSNGHLQFRDTMATMFELPCAYATSMKSAVTALSPWGWSAQMRHRFFKAMGFGKDLLPSDAEIERMRNLSSRVLTIDVLTELRAAGIDTPPLPRYMNNLADVITFVEGHERCVVKAPWSGSGKGIMWGIGHAEEPLVHFCKGVIRRQGGVVCEHFLNVKQEFAMEFYADVAGVQFVGYSLFTAENGAYQGNMLAPDDDIEEVLTAYISKEKLAAAREALCGIMQKQLSGSGYCGYFGIDMMLYDNGDGCRLNPCMEINLRMNMGVVSRIFYDRFVACGRKGIYRVRFFKQPGEAYSFHMQMQAAHPLVVENSRVVGGYMSLVPVTPENRYVAYVTIGDDIC